MARLVIGCLLSCLAGYGFAQTITTPTSILNYVAAGGQLPSGLWEPIRLGKDGYVICSKTN